MIRKNLTPLAFYASFDEQQRRNTGPYAGARALYVPSDSLIPFQVILQGNGEEYDSCELVNADGQGLAYDLETCYGGAVESMSYTGEDYAVCSYVPAKSYDLPEGRYYIHLKTDAQDYYSDVFVAVKDVSGMLTITWSSENDVVCDGGRIAYEGTGYVNVLYVPAELSFPEYRFDEEGEDRDGFNFPVKQTSEKVYKFTMGATEGMCDALRLVRLSDTVVVTDRYGNTYLCDTFLMTPSPLDGGYMASVECEFETDTVVIQPAKALTHPQAPAVYLDGELVSDADEIELDFEDGKFIPITLVATTPVTRVIVEADSDSWVVSNKGQFITIGLTTNDEDTTADITLHTVGGVLSFTVSAMVVAEFEFLEWLESDGACYIDTGIKGSPDLSFDCQFSNPGPNTSGGYGNVFGARKASQDNAYQLTKYGDGSIMVGATNALGTFGSSDIHTISYDGEGMAVVDGTGVSLNTGPIDQSQVGTIILFGIRNANLATQLQAGKIYYCSFGAEHDFRPARRISDDELGMYDMVTGNFLTNLGTGTFTGGPVLP